MPAATVTKQKLARKHGVPTWDEFSKLSFEEMIELQKQTEGLLFPEPGPSIARPPVEKPAHAELLMREQEKRRELFEAKTTPYLKLAAKPFEVAEQVAGRVGEQVAAKATTAVRKLNSLRWVEAFANLNASFTDNIADILEFTFPALPYGADPVTEGIHAYFQNLAYDAREESKEHREWAGRMGEWAERESNIMGIPVPDIAAREVGPPSNAAELVTDIGVGIAEFVGVLLATKKVAVPATLSQASQAVAAWGTTYAVLEWNTEGSTPESIKDAFGQGAYTGAVVQQLSMEVKAVGSAIRRQSQKFWLDKMGARVKVSFPGGKRVGTARIRRADAAKIKTAIKQRPDVVTDLYRVPKEMIPGGQMGEVYVAPGEPTLTPSQKIAAAVAAGRKPGAMRAAFVAIPGKGPPSGVPGKPIGKAPPPGVAAPAPPAQAPAVPPSAEITPPKPAPTPTEKALPVTKETFREFVQSQDKGVGDPNIPSLWETAQQDPELMGQLQAAYKAQRAVPAKPGKPITEQIKMTPAQRIKLAMQQREMGRLKGKKAGIKEAAQAVAEGKVSTVQGLLTYARTHIPKKLSQAEQRGFRAGQLEIQASHKELTAFAKKYLPTLEVGKVMPAIANARTPAQVQRAIKAVNRIVNNYDRKLAIDEFEAARKKLDLRHLDEAARQKAEVLLDTFTEVTPSDKLLRRMESRLAAAEREGGEQVPAALVDRARQTLARAEKTPLKKLPPDAIRTIAATLLNIEHTNATKNRLRFSRNYQDAQETLELATGEVGSRNPVLPGRERIAEEGGEPGKFVKDKSQSALARLATWDQLSLETKAYLLGGDKGAVYDLLYRGPHRGQRDFIQLQQQAGQVLADAGISFDPKKLRLWSDTANKPYGRIRSTIREKLGKEVRTKAELLTIKLPEARGAKGQRVLSVEVTRAEWAELYAHISDPSTRAELAKRTSQGITFRRGGAAIKLTNADLAAIWTQAPTEIKDVVKAMKDYINGPQRDVLNTSWVEQHGYPIARRTDYWPRQRNADYRETDPDKMMQMWHERQLENQGIFKPRTRAIEPIIVGDIFATYFAHINKASAYIAKNQAAQDAMRLLGDTKPGGFVSMVKSRFKHGDDLIGDLEASIRSYRGLQIPAQDAMSRFVSRQIRRAHKGALGFKPHIVLYQSVSYLNASNEIDAKYLAKVWNWKLPTSDMLAEINEHSPELAARFSGGAHQILTPSQTGTSLGRFYTGREGGITEAGLAPIHGMDTVVMVNLWQATKAEALDQGLTEGSEAFWEHVRDRTEDIVARTQPTWDPLTVSSLARTGKEMPIVKVVATMFSSQRNKNFNMAVRATSEYRHSKKTVADQFKYARKLIIPTLANAIGIYAIQAISRAAYRGFRRREKETPITDHAWGVAQRLLGNWLIFGELVSTVGAKAKAAIEGKPLWMARVPENVISGPLSDLEEAVGYTIQAAISLGTGAEYKVGVRKGELKWKRQATQAAYAGVRAISMLAGIPAAGPLMIAKQAIPPSQKIRDYQTKSGLRALGKPTAPDSKRLDQIFRTTQQQGITLSDAEFRFRRDWEDRGYNTKSKAYKAAIARLRRRWRTK